MKLLTNQINKFKTLYKRNKFLGILLAVGIFLLCIVFSPELLIIFAPQWIFKKVWSLSLSKVWKVVLLLVCFALLGLAIYGLFNVIHGVLEVLTGGRK
jgi:uncharacterized membrane protein (DUF485 family)